MSRGDGQIGGTVRERMNEGRRSSGVFLPAATGVGRKHGGRERLGFMFSVMGMNGKYAYICIFSRFKYPRSLFVSLIDGSLTRFLIYFKFFLFNIKL